MRVSVFALIFAIAGFAQRSGIQQEVKIQKTSLTRDQEIQLGKEAAAEVERTKEVVHNADVEAWLNQVGQQLARTPQANAYPYYFKLVNDDSINAFALPGGPMFVHTGLLRAADTEGEVAGVLAHEMSHVALRHGAAQLSKQQTWGTLFGVLGAAAGAALGGQNGECGLWCRAVQTGAGLGGNSVLMKFSRSYERDADLNGARMMASAGYDPMDLARFFEKLEAKLGSAAEPKGLALWMSDHPGTGSRVQYVADDIQFYPKRPYTASTGRFPRIKQIVASLPPPKPQPAEMLQPRDKPVSRTVPSGFKDYQAAGFAIAYPSSWQAGQAQQGGSFYLIPQGGAVKTQSGGLELLLGGMVDYYRPPESASGLESATASLVDSLARGDRNLRSEKPVRLEVGRKPAMLTRITTRTTSQPQDQAVWLYTVQTDAGLWHLVLATPTARAAEVEPVFHDIVQSVQFPN